MKPALTLRAALEELMPQALYRLPPEDAPRGLEGAVQVFHPEGDRVRDSLSASPPDDESDDEDDYRELEEMFELGPDVAEKVPALGADDTERIRQAVLVNGVDALGWYVPFHVIGHQWGIYVKTSSLAYLAGNVFGSIPVDDATRVRLAFRAIHQHELFHFAMEYAVAQLELLVAEPIHIHRARLKDPKLGYLVAEERAANAWMLRSLRSAKPTLRFPGRAKALRGFISAQPPGYREAGELVGIESLRAASHELLVEHMTTDSRGADRMNLDWLLPIAPRVDWRQCPVHILSEGKRLPFAPGALDLFANVRGIVLTPSFEKDLRKLPRQFQRAWEKTERMLSTSTAITGLDFKLWERSSAGRVYSVRVSQGYRAHLRYNEQGIWFAEGIGSHAAMGHG